MKSEIMISVCRLNGKALGLIAVASILVAGGTVFGIYINNGLPDPVVPIGDYTGAVVTNGVECAEIGANILRMGGSAADAAIAALFCEGVALPQSMGLGGGFLLTIYTKETGTVETLIARETAPAAATKNMYNGSANLAKTGSLSIAVPGELRGYWELYKKYGYLDWAELIQPTIDLCRKGHFITPFLATAFKGKEKQILEEPSMREIFINPKTNETWGVGTYLKRPKLAETLEIIANEGGNALHNGSLTKMFVEELQRRGSIITEDDMKNYKPLWEDPITTTLEDDMTLFTVPLPGSGVVLTFILNILNGFLDKINYMSLTNWQRIVESFKFAYGRRTELGDSRYVSGIEELVSNLTSKTYAEEVRKHIYDNRTFQDPTYYGANYSVPEDHGTANIVILAPNGDAVAVTSTINLVFGSLIRSETTGIILNDEMDDFSAPNITNSFNIPPSPANYIKPGKRPLSSMCPTIIIDKNGDVRLAVGAAGGSKITTSVTLTILKNLWYGQPLERAVDEKRLHHQLYPMKIQFEEDFDQIIVEGLAKIGHKYMYVDPKDGFAAVTAISNENGTIFGQFDIRRQGSIVKV